MSVAGKDDAPVIAACARISSICAVVPLSTISMSWLVPSSFQLSFKPSLDFLTDALGYGLGLPPPWFVPYRVRAQACSRPGSWYKSHNPYHNRAHIPLAARQVRFIHQRTRQFLRITIVVLR